jgi:hypothetical protein
VSTKASVGGDCGAGSEYRLPVPCKTNHKAPLYSCLGIRGCISERIGLQAGIVLSRRVRVV